MKEELYIIVDENEEYYVAYGDFFDAENMYITPYPRFAYTHKDEEMCHRALKKFPIEKCVG